MLSFRSIFLAYGIILILLGLSFYSDMLMYERHQHDLAQLLSRLQQDDALPLSSLRALETYSKQSYHNRLSFPEIIIAIFLICSVTCGFYRHESIKRQENKDSD